MPIGPWKNRSFAKSLGENKDNLRKVSSYKRAILLTAGLLVAIDVAVAQSAGEYQAAWAMIQGGHPLTAFELFSESESVQIRQNLKQFYCFIGRYDKAVDRPAAMGPDPEPSDQDLTLGLEPVDAIGAIVAEARKHRIILLNEAHNVGAHRAFARRVVRALAKEGFGYLGMETLNPLSPDLEHPDPVPRTIGTYSNDPVYAAIIRAAIAEHYRLVAYESIEPPSSEGVPTSPCDDGVAEAWVHAPPKDQDIAAKIMHREKNEACHLAQTIRSLPLDARILVYAGYSHIHQKPQNGIPWMAAYLREYLGEPVISIDQTYGDANLYSRKTAKSAPILTQIFQRFDIKSEVVIRRADGGYFVPRGQEASVDMLVLRPDTGDRNNWWQPDDMLIEVWIDAPDRERGWPLGLVAATIPGTGPDKVPLDQVFVGEQGVRSVRMLLPKGQAFIVEEEGKMAIKPIGMIDVAPAHVTPTIEH